MDPQFDRLGIDLHMFFFLRRSWMIDFGSAGHARSLWKQKDGLVGGLLQTGVARNRLNPQGLVNVPWPADFGDFGDFEHHLPTPVP